MNKPLLSATLAVALLGGTGAAVVSSNAAAGTLANTPQVQTRPLNILLTNDDGWRGPGGSSTPLIVELRDTLESAGHHVVVVAPGTDQSGQGGRITLRPLQLTLATPEPDVYTVTPGSPSDSVYFALDEIFAGAKPDLVVSGVNPGSNLGQAVNHSGTVNAATTALELGVPSVAVSLETPPPGWPGGTAAAAPGAASYVVDLVERLQRSANGGTLMPTGVSLNVNLPLRPGPIDPATGQPGSVLPPRGERLTTVASGPFLNFDYQNTSGQAGEPGTYNILLGVPDGPASAGTDTRAVKDGYISVTPLEADRDLDRATERWLDRIL